MQANQTSVLWTVIVASVVILATGFWMNSVQNAAREQFQTDVNAKLIGFSNQLTTGLTALNNIPTTIDIDPSLCANIDGCGGWWDVPSALRDDVVNRVVDELTENDNRDLYREIRDLVDVDDESDIISTSTHRIGEVRQNENPDYNASEDRLITADFILKVKYYEDGSSDEKTKYFRVQSTLSELEDGLTQGEVSYDSVEVVNKDFQLP